MTEIKTYTLIDGRITCGQYPFSSDKAKGVKKLMSILDLGVTHFIDLTEVHEQSTNSELLERYESYLKEIRSQTQIQYTNIAIPDERLKWKIDRFLNVRKLVLKNLKEAKHTYVHCRGGYYRTSLLACLVLVEFNEKDAQVVLSELYKTFEKAKFTLPPGYNDIGTEIKPYVVTAINQLRNLRT